MRARALLALACVGGCVSYHARVEPDAGEPDGPVTGDALSGDAPPDVFVGCPADFVQIAQGGQNGHLYKVEQVARTWAAQATTCLDAGGYLAVPDDISELKGIFNAAGGQAWVGIDDQVTEGAFFDSLNNPYTALAILGNNAMDDCVVADTNDTLAADTCNLVYLAVCECQQ